MDGREPRGHLRLTKNLSPTNLEVIFCKNQDKRYFVIISVSNIILVSAHRQQRGSVDGHEPRGHLRLTKNLSPTNLEVIFCKNQDKRYFVIISVSNIILVSAHRQQRGSVDGREPRGHLRLTKNLSPTNLEVIFCKNQDKRYFVIISVSNIILVSAHRQQRGSVDGHEPRSHLRLTKNLSPTNLEVIFCKNQDKRYFVIISVSNIILVSAHRQQKGFRGWARATGSFKTHEKSLSHKFRGNIL